MVVPSKNSETHSPIILWVVKIATKDTRLEGPFRNPTSVDAGFTICRRRGRGVFFRAENAVISFVPLDASMCYKQMSIGRSNSSYDRISEQPTSHISILVA